MKAIKSIAFWLVVASMITGFMTHVIETSPESDTTYLWNGDRVENGQIIEK